MQTELTGRDLLTAYQTLYPGEILTELITDTETAMHDLSPQSATPNPQSAMSYPFQHWLTCLLSGDVEHRLALDQSHTGKRTRALLAILGIEAPATATGPDLVTALGLEPAVKKHRMHQRAQSLRRLDPPNNRT